MPCSASSAQVVSSTSNMIAFANAAKYSMPSSTTVDVRAARAEPVTRRDETREQEEARERAQQRHRARGPRVHARHEPARVDQPEQQRRLLRIKRAVEMRHEEFAGLRISQATAR